MARARLYNGLTDIQQGQVEVGRKEIEEAVKLDPGNARAQLLLGEVSLRMGAPAAAEKAALEVLKRNPSNVLAATLLADSFLARKEWKKAEQIYQAMIKQLPKNPVGYLKMGLSRKLQGKPGEAAGFFAQAVEQNPKDLTAINEYIFALAAAKDTAKAKKGAGRDGGEGAEEPAAVGHGRAVPARFREAGRGGGGVPEEHRAGAGLHGSVLPAGRDLRRAEEVPGGREAAGEGHRAERQERGGPCPVGDGAQLAGEAGRGEQGVPEGAVAVAEERAGGEQPRVEPGGWRREPGRGVEVRPGRPGSGPEEPSVGDTLGWVYYKKGCSRTPTR